MTIELRARRPDLTAMSERQLWERFEHLLPVHRKLFAEHIFTTYMASVPAGVISTIADAVGRPDLVWRSSAASATSTQPRRATRCGRSRG